MKILILPICIFLLASSFLNAGILHVPGDYPTIQAALVYAGTGDTILVAPGTYYEHIGWPSIQGINLLSEYGADSTIIDAAGLLRAITIVADVDSTTVIRGFTIVNGNTDRGGGIYCEGASPTISNNTIMNNSAGGYGGGVFCINGSPIISQNIIINNVATGNGNGGGIACWESSPKIIGNIIENNSAGNGGGIYAIASEPEIIGNTVNSNSSGYGGGLLFHKSSVIVTYNTVSNNDAEYLGDGLHFGDADGDVNYNNIFGNGWGISGYGYWGRNAEYNWWGDSTGPYHATNPGGLGDTVGDDIDFTPWLYVPWGIEEYKSVHQVTTILEIFPNPFSKLTYISFGKVQGAKSIELKIYDATGRMVKNLFRSTPDALRPTLLSWYGDDNSGKKLPQGVYFVRLNIEDYSEKKKVIFIK